MPMLIQNARVIDPSQGLDEVMDLLLEDGKIAQLGSNLPAQNAQVVDGTAWWRRPAWWICTSISGIRASPTRRTCTPAAGRRPRGRHQPTGHAQHKARHGFPGNRPGAAGARPNRRRRRVHRRLRHQGLAGGGAGGPGRFEGGGGNRPQRRRQAGGTPGLLEALEQAPSLGLTVTAHCEDLYLASGGLMHEGEVSHKLGVPGIPAAAEDCGTAREIAAAASIGAPIHICHVSTKGSVALIRDAKVRGVQVTAETCPHYLLLTDKALESQDADYRMNPPLREEEDRLALIEGLKDGTLDAIATDHAPHTPQEKADFRKAPNGSIGMETSLAATLTALEGVLTLPQILEKMSTAPARILGIPAGTLQVGANADVVLFDPQREGW